MLSRLRRSVLVGAALAVAGCLSPTLPLPPPNEPQVSQVSEGVYLLSGGVPPRSEVYAYNARTSFIDGQATDESGKYAFEIQAAPGDSIELWYSKGAKDSQITRFEIPDP
jgi:hypothetical protein